MYANSRKSARLIAGLAGAGALVFATGITAVAAPSPAVTPDSSSTAAPLSTAAPSPSPSQPSTTVPPSTSEPAPTTSNQGDSEGATLSVTPKSVKPGQDVVVRLSCLGERGPIKAPELRLDGAEGAAGSTYNNASVPSVTTPGTYTVSSSCAGKPLSATFTVNGATHKKPVPISEHQVSVVPKGPAETGDGSLAADG